MNIYVNMYVRAIQAGKKELEDVPEHLQEAVSEALEYEEV